MTAAIRILITGSRTWTDAWRIAEAIEKAIAEHDADDITIVHGACPSGADQLAAEYAEIMAAWYDGAGRQLAEERHPAEWPKHDANCPPSHQGMRKCKRAGHRRNAEMAALGADICLAFIEPCDDPKCPKPKPHDSHGTAGMVRDCKKADIDVRPFRATVGVR
jgi:hypothetical protein